LKSLFPTDAAYSDGDVDTNPSLNPSLDDVIRQRYSRRQTLFGGISAAAAAVAGGALVAACGGGDGDDSVLTVTVPGAINTSSGEVVVLTGTGNGQFDTLAWTQVSGPAVTLTDDGKGSASFIAPAVATATPLAFRLSAARVNNRNQADTIVTVAPALLTFTAVPKGLADIVAVPSGYTVTVLYRLGDPINAATPAFANNGTDAGYSARAGDHHDGMSYFGLAATGNAPDQGSSARGLLVLNHENINQSYLHPNGPTTVAGARPTAEVVKEMECHGVSVVEITRSSAGVWSYVQASALNRRITPYTPMRFNGPVKGNPLIFTAYSPTGETGRGTINNCANGYMPWYTYATCEENWAGYFRREAGDDARRAAALGAKAVTAFNRYGLGTGSGDTLKSGNYQWTTAAPTASGNTDIAKFNATVVAGQPVNGTGDFRNEPNQYGWVVEIDPFNPASVPRKRTALGRMNHEGVCPGRVIEGVRPAFYMGDDAQNEYIYKFVSTQRWTAADASPSDRLAAGDKYLDSGMLYVARFNADGSGVWLPLVFGQGPLTAANAVYPFADQADVLTHCRLAADAVGATRMDRPEWTAVHPVTGEMYCTLTNNSSRTPAGGANPTDAANPRAYNDPKTTGSVTRGNANGHIVRLRETGDTTEATSFAWDIYAFGAGSDLDRANINLSGLDATNDFSSPDGLWFGRPSNVQGQVKPMLWIETDDGAYTDVTNCMLLAAIPGTVNDGTTRTVTNTVTSAAGAVTTGTQATRVGALPGASLKRFLVGPKQCEITGIDSTPDGRSLFVNIQHPGEDGGPSNITSNWPANQGGTVATGSRPRSATIVITKNDGGIVGL
jgi:hypothetical protein